MLILLSGASGTGKNTIINFLMKDFEEMKGKQIEDVKYIISTTTRKMRVEDNECEGNPYHFISKEEFEKQIAEGKFFEWNKVHGDLLYGVPNESVEIAQNKNVVVIKDLDVEGHRAYKEKLKDSGIDVFSIFLALSKEELTKRLKARGEDDESIALRLSRLEYENSFAKEYDFIVQNTNSKITSRLIEYKVLDIMNNSKERLEDKELTLDDLPKEEQEENIDSNNSTQTEGKQM
ncbi:MAG: AAA family ATPase [Clostridia bacterium]|nr:AAA family ATPase [Clostridia bacterium]